MTDEIDTTIEERLCDLLDYAHVTIGNMLIDLPDELKHLAQRLTAIRAQMITIDMELLWDPTRSLPLGYSDVYQAALAGDPGPHDRERKRDQVTNETRH
jgi:hypothetical protein